MGFAEFYSTNRNVVILFALSFICKTNEQLKLLYFSFDSSVSNKKLFHLTNCVFRVCQGVPELYDLALLIDEEICEIPGDLSGHFLLLVVEFAVFAQILVNGVCGRPVHLDLGEHGEPHSVSHGSSLDFLIGARLLVFELVAGERQNLETLVSILLVDLYHPLVVLVSETSLRSYVDNENGFFTLDKLT